MAGLLHMYEYNPESMGKKHQNQIGGGFDAPRNSLESPAESLQSYYTAGESAPLSRDASRSTSHSSSCSTDALMKKFINDTISKGTNQKQQTPSIVARLMGMDAPPLEKKLFFPPFERMVVADELNEGMQKQKMEKVFSKKSKSSLDNDLKISRKNAYFRLWNKSKHGKPHARVHPQEKELQKFKKDFEAWQAARFLECARIVQLGNIPEQWLAQLGLTKEKMDVYETARESALEKVEPHKSNTIMRARISSGSVGDLQYSESKRDLSIKHKNLHHSRKQTLDRELDGLSVADFDQKSDKSSAPSRIVILKPGPESLASNDESWVSSSSSSVADRDCIGDLLEEVKERLKCELHGKPVSRGSMIRGGGIETPFKEKPLQTKLKPCGTTTPARENTTEDHGRRCLRSELSKSYRTDIQPIEFESPELLNRDTRNILSDCIRYVLKEEDTRDIPDVTSCSSRSLFDDTRKRLEQAKNILNASNEGSCWNDGNYGQDGQARSFRQEFADEEKSHRGSSPRSMVRSLSAPASRTSFGKLLLEDRQMQNGAHHRRKHEASENSGMLGKSQKKDKFNIREKVSNIKSNLTFRGKLFNRKLRSSDLSQRQESDLTKDETSESAVMLNFYERNDNYTEVPPSPASVCSSAQEEFWKPIDHPSPLSTSDIISVGDRSVRNVFREISSNLSELRRQLNQLDCEGSEVATVTDEPVNAELLDLEDESEAYIKDLLVTSGFYDGSSDQYLSRWDPFMKHIGDWVFEKVEESYGTQYEEMDASEETASNHKMLFHLLNEALCAVLRPPMNLSRFSRKIISSPIFPPLRGRRLLNKVWEIICDYIYPSPDNGFDSFDDMLSHDLDLIPWYNINDLEEIKLVAKELEARITAQLIAEVVKEMLEICVLALKN